MSCHFSYRIEQSEARGHGLIPYYLMLEVFEKLQITIEAVFNLIAIWSKLQG